MLFILLFACFLNVRLFFSFLAWFHVWNVMPPKGGSLSFVVIQTYGFGSFEGQPGKSVSQIQNPNCSPAHLVTSACLSARDHNSCLLLLSPPSQSYNLKVPCDAVSPSPFSFFFLFFLLIYVCSLSLTSPEIESIPLLSAPLFRSCVSLRHN